MLNELPEFVAVFFSLAYKVLINPNSIAQKLASNAKNKTKVKHKLNTKEETKAENSRPNVEQTNKHLHLAFINRALFMCLAKNQKAV